MSNMSVVATLSPYPCPSVLEDRVGTYSFRVSRTVIPTIFYNSKEMLRHYRMLVNTSNTVLLIIKLNSRQVLNM